MSASVKCVVLIRVVSWYFLGLKRIQATPTKQDLDTSVLLTWECYPGGGGGSGGGGGGGRITWNGFSRLEIYKNRRLTW